MAAKFGVLLMALVGATTHPAAQCGVQATTTERSFGVGAFDGDLSPRRCTGSYPKRENVQVVLGGPAKTL
jgi:hypothetical protein